ncbi:MAG: hypothetical protein FWG70_05575 [Oscillospiraceae bacterium]|nr:hypothetical protein [Oscillospiraceae bacterium]
MKKALFSVLYLLVPSFFISPLIFANDSTLGAACIIVLMIYPFTIKGLKAFYKNNFCNVIFLFFGFILSALSWIPAGILWSVRRGFEPFAVIAYTPIFVAGWSIIYTLPFSIITEIFLHKKEEFKKG